MLNLNAFTRHSRRAAAFAAFAIGAVAFTGSAAAAPQAPLFPFFLAPPTQYSQPQYAASRRLSKPLPLPMRTRPSNCRRGCADRS